MSQYRQAAVQAASEAVSHDEHLEVMRPATWIAGTALVGLLAVGLGWSFFVDVPITVSSEGILASPAGVIDVVSDTQGILGDLLVEVGSRIAPGAVLARVEQPEVRLDLAAAEGTRSDAQAFLDRLREDQAQERRALGEFRRRRDAALAEQVRLLDVQRNAVAARSEAMRALSARQVVTQDRVLAVSAEFISLEAQVAQAHRERNQLALDEETTRLQRQREVLEAERRVVEASRAVDSIRYRLDRLGTVRAEYGGRVIELKANGGAAMQRGTPVLMMERDGEGAAARPVAIVYLPARDGKKVLPGQAVEVSPVHTRREEDGFIRGRVVGVSEVPSSSEGMRRTLHNDQLVRSFSAGMASAPFEVRVELDTWPDAPERLRWSTRTAPEVAIEPGTLAQVTITTRSVRLITLVVPVVRRLLGIDLILGAHDTV